MQDRVLDEISELLDILKKKTEHCEQNAEYEFEISEPIDVSVGSIINSVLFGYRFSGDKLQEFYELKSLLRRLFESFSNPFMLATINHPKFFRKLPFFKSAINNTLDCNDSLFKFFEKQINEHIEIIDFETESAPTDFIEAFLREAKRRDKDGLEHTFSTKQLKSVCSDLWIAGQETTSTTLNWGIYFLMSHPTVQARLQSELDSVIGSDRMVTISDKSKLPFTNAVVDEVQRAANLLPLNLLRRTTREVNIDGHVIPKGTNVSPMISCVLYDPKIFPNPKAFDPGRFIDENGAFRKCDEIIPFSIGKRQCLGEGLARMELFLFIANIFNMFKIIPSPISGLPSADRKWQMITAQPPKFKCRIKARHR
ncbi:cytochrome p450 domain-containing protein [Ditylenchus destructor]|nr:cytochrome p450 domain-containing protein [Ditylenchus destructor]